MTGPITALTRSCRRLLTFSGTASRAEFWWVFAACALALGAAITADLMMLGARIAAGGPELLTALRPGGLATLWTAAATGLFLLSLTVRRLHDTGRSGWWVLLGLLPVVGGIALLALCALPGRAAITPRRVRADGQTARPAAQAKRPSSRQSDPYARAMQGYAVLFEEEQAVSPEMQAARKAEISEYYRTKVLKPAAQA